MKSFLSQDFLTLRGSAAGTITQGEQGWLDLPGVSNAVAWLDVKEITLGGGTVQVSFQTSPEQDDSLFVPMTGPTTTVPFSPSLGVTVTPLLKELLGFGNGLGYATGAPLSRWFRWQIIASGTFSSTWDITFRLFLAAHCLTPGHQRQDQR